MKGKFIKKKEGKEVKVVPKLPIIFQTNSIHSKSAQEFPKLQSTLKSARPGWDRQSTKN